MKKEDFIIRNEEPSDYRIVEEVTREAFWNNHVQGCDEHYLMHIMRSSNCFIPELDFVAEIDGKIVGNIVYTKAKVVDDSGSEHEVISFGPISVLPDFQGVGIGIALIEHTKKIAKNLGYNAIFIYGDPDYYSKTGFIAAEKYDIASSENQYVAALQCLELFPDALSGIKGRFFEDEVYILDQEASKEFDKGFPKKEIMDGLPSQLRFQELIKMHRPR